MPAPGEPTVNERGGLQPSPAPGSDATHLMLEPVGAPAPRAASPEPDPAHVPTGAVRVTAPSGPLQDDSKVTTAAMPVLQLAVETPESGAPSAPESPGTLLNDPSEVQTSAVRAFGLVEPVALAPAEAESTTAPHRQLSPAAAPADATPTPLLAPLQPPVSNAKTHLRLDAAPAATVLKLDPVAAPPAPPWLLVLAGSLGTAALIAVLALALFRLDRSSVVEVAVPTPAVQVSEAPRPALPVETKTPTVPSLAPAFAPAEQRKESFYPEKPSNVEKRGVVPNRKFPPRGVVRVVTTAQGNVVSAQLFVDGRAVGSTPKDLAGLSVGEHRFQVAYRDEPAVTFQYPVTPPKLQKQGAYLEIEVSHEPDATRRNPVVRLGERADRPVPTLVPRERR